MERVQKSFVFAVDIVVGRLSHHLSVCLFVGGIAAAAATSLFRECMQHVHVPMHAGACFAVICYMSVCVSVCVCVCCFICYFKDYYT